MNKLLGNPLLNGEIYKIEKSGQCHHAYLLTGERGSGKKTAALLLAAACIADGSHFLKSGGHPDIKLCAPKDSKRSLSVAEIRDLRADSMLPPTIAKRKVYIIDSAHTLSADCQNALLTVLEQPPQNTVFILLTSSRGALLATLRSRLFEFVMQPLTKAEVLKYLKDNTNTDPQKAEAAAAASSGNIGFALEILADKGIHNGLKNALTCYRLIAAGKRYALIKLISGLSKDDFKTFLRVFVLFTRDIIVFKETNNVNCLLFSKTVLQNDKIFIKINVGRLFEYVSGANNCLRLLDRSVNQAILAAAFAAELV